MRPVNMKIKVDDLERSVFAFDTRKSAPERKPLISEVFEPIKAMNSVDFTFHYIVQCSLLKGSKCLKIKTKASDIHNGAAIALSEAQINKTRLGRVSFFITQGQMTLLAVDLQGVTVKSIKPVGNDKEVTTLEFENTSWGD